MSRYRTMFRGTLVQESALSVGGTEGGPPFVDSILCRDGQDRYVLRGQTLAGALIATSRKFVREVPKHITGLENSRWQFYNSHPVREAMPEFRQGVGIRQDTGAAAGHVLFDVEVLPRKTTWPFLLEVETSGDGLDGVEAERIAAAALLEWRRGRCWLGRDVARGLGWLHLDDLRAYRLDSQLVDSWPDSGSRNPADVLDALIERAKGVEVIEAPVFAKTFQQDPTESGWSYLEIEGRIHVGVRDDGYGLDALAVGGHGTVAAASEWDNAHFLKPAGRGELHQIEAFAPDHTIVMTRGAGDKPEPFLPGSGLRGPLRHLLSRSLRALGVSVRDPNLDPGNAAAASDPPALLFGTLESSSAILVRDAYLEEPDAWTAAWIQHHAEDEFSGGVYGAGKFDRTMLLSGIFSWKVVVETDDDNLLKLVNKYLPPFQRLAKAGHFPIGGAKWRSAGWPIWTIDHVRGSKAGEDYVEQE